VSIDLKRSPEAIDNPRACGIAQLPAPHEGLAENFEELQELNVNGLRMRKSRQRRDPRPSLRSQSADFANVEWSLAHQ
jgi:hypothetical protein